MNILITGGLGHIGSYFIENSLDNLTTVDNLLTQRYCSLFNWKNKNRFIEKDFGDISIDDLNKIDCVIHLAALTDAQNSFGRENIEKEYIKKTHTFIKLCKKCNIQYFIFPSSTSVYGVSTNVVTEDPKYLNPQSPYAETKLAIEKIIQDELTTSNTKYLILRCGTIFGTSIGMRFHTAINKFCFQAVFNQPLTIWKDNYNQVRPYLGIDDLYNTIFSLFNSDKWNEIYNIVSENKTTKEIVDIIKQYKDVNINFIDTPLLNQYTYNVSNEKIISIYKPQQRVQQGIKETLKLLGKNRWDL
jgi:nucleoside-diphosphate-sugar epimerase